MQYDTFKFESEDTTELQIEVVPSEQYEVALDPAAAKVNCLSEFLKY